MALTKGNRGKEREGGEERKDANEYRVYSDSKQNLIRLKY